MKNLAPSLISYKSYKKKERKDDLFTIFNEKMNKLIYSEYKKVIINKQNAKE